MEDGDKEVRTVTSVADAWADALDEGAKEDPSLGTAGSRRRSSGGGAAAPIAPSVKTDDVLPLVKGLGALSCRMARVSDLSEEEARDIAEPSAHLLTILAPETPPWAIPLMTLGARVGAVVESRRDEFIANRPKADKALVEPETEVVEDF